jgi:ligand-binding sensor protein
MSAALETTRQSPTTLVELIGRETLQTIQDAFATAFDIPTVILDHEGQNVNEITFRVKFCEDLTRQSTASARCLTCDVAAMRTSEVTHRPTTFECWNGLYDSTVPIVSSDGRLFGHFLAGQVHFSAPKEYGRWRTIARELGLDEDEYEQAAREIRVISEEVYLHRIDCLGILARMIADQASAALANRVLLDDALSAHDQTRRMTDELEAIASGVSAISGSDDLFAVVARLVEAARGVVDFDGAAVYVRRSPDVDVVPILMRDDGLVDADVYRRGVEIALDGSIPAINGSERTLAMPLVLDGEALGALIVHRHAPAVFGSHERDLLTIVGGQVAAAIGVSRLREETQRVLAIAMTRDSELRQVSADVDGEVILMRLLAEAVQALAASDAALIPRALGVKTLFRDESRPQERRFDAAFEGALARARGSGKGAETRFAGKQIALIMPAAAVGSRVGFDLVIWRDSAWTPLDIELVRSLAAGVEFVADAQRRRDASRQGAARQRALSQLITGLETSGAEGLLSLDQLVADAVGAERVYRIQRSDLAGVAVARSVDNDGVEVAYPFMLQGDSSLRMPDAIGDHARWDGWGARVLTAIGCEGSEGIVCTPIASSTHYAALIVETEGRRSDEVRVRLQTAADLIGLATASDSRVGGLADGRSFVFEQILLAVNDGRAAVRRAACDGYIALGGVDPAFDPFASLAEIELPTDRSRFVRCLEAARRAVEEREDAERAHVTIADARQQLDRSVAEAREQSDYAYLLMEAVGGENPAAAIVFCIASVRGCAVLLEDVDGWTVSGDDVARGGESIDLIADDEALLGRLWLERLDDVANTTGERLAATIGLRQTLATAAHHQSIRSALVGALIDSSETTSDLRLRCDEIGFDLAVPRRVCVSGVDATGGSVDQVVRWVSAWLVRQDDVGLVSRRDRSVVLIGPENPSWFAEAIAAVSDVYPNTYAGLGHVASGIAGMQRSYISGRQAADVLRVTGRIGVLEIQDDSLESILLEAAEPARLVRFVESVLRPLEEYDERKSAELLRSLTAAVDLSWNLQAAARSCHVHVTTFRYRLARIEQLIGIDLSGADGRLTVELALRARRVLS